MIIGLSGKARSGKDTVAEMIQGYDSTFKRIAFADSLKDAACAIFDWDDRHRHGELKERLDSGFKTSPRAAFQDLGQWVREHFGEDTWVKSAMKKAAVYENVVVPDVRYPNEVKAIERLGGQVWRVERPGIDGVRAHQSETALDDWPFKARIYNTGSLEDLRSAVTFALKGGDRNNG